VTQTGWTCSYPGTGASCKWSVTLTSHQVDTGNDFGNFFQADLSVTKSGKITYTVESPTTGPSTAINVKLDDTLPGALTWTENPDKSECTITGNALHCDIASLANAASFSVTVEANIAGQGNNPAAA